MLRFLRIRNLAVIEAVDVEFDRGFTVLTGETGAGKSILVEAVGLLLGARASADMVRTGEAQASIEAAFDDANGEELIVRRELTPQGRSRSFVNGALATAAALRELSNRLVELHGQHEHQTLLDPLTHLAVLDAYAGLEDRVEQVGVLWALVKARREAVARARMDARERSARLDLVSFQLGEIDAVRPTAGEDEELAATRQVLASAERLQRLCQESYAALYESDGAVLTTLSGVWKRLGELATIEPQFVPYVEARDAIKSQLEDLAFFLQQYGGAVDASPERLQQVEDRLAAIERLKRKYGPQLSDVIARRDSLARERDLLAGGGGSPEQLEEALAADSAVYLAAARELSASRRAAAASFAPDVERLLAELAMTRTRFEVRFGDRELPPEQWGDTGIDVAEFYLSPNVGEELRPLARIVSGGELSRVMLALKTLSASRDYGSGQSPRTLIFDEVDAGIGGRVAEIVGARLRELGDRFQVLCITHLPQIAAQATAQFHIAKSVRRGRTVTTVSPLEKEARVEEIARMLGGSQMTETLLASARELIGRPDGGRKAKPKAKGESESRWRKSI